MSGDNSKAALELTLPGAWTREDLVRDYRTLTPYYFTSDGNWKSQIEVKWSGGEVLGQLLGTERSGGWILRGMDFSPVLHMRLKNMDLGLAGMTVLFPFKKVWEILESVDPIPWKRYELEKIDDEDHLIMVGINSILDGRERWTRRPLR